MKFLYWNIRGIANKSSRDTLFSFTKQISPDVICLAEPMIEPDKFPLSFLRSINMHLLSFNSRDGCSKIWVLCSNNITEPIVFSNSDQEITLDFGSTTKTFRVTFIYASVLIATRRRLWNSIRCLSPNSCPWILIGDFNAILGSHERMGGNLPNPTSCQDFANMIAENDLQEIEAKGAFFT